MVRTESGPGRYVFVLMVLFLCLPIPASGEKGSLFIIGGGDRPDDMIRKIVELAGGEKAVLRVIPNASGAPVETAEYQVNQFSEFGAPDVDYHFLTREQADTDSAVALLDGVTGIFFSGGDQRRLPRDLLGTRFLEAIRNIHRNGGLISGTSAGAAVMSELMITGDELRNTEEEKFIDIQQGNIDYRKGFGFLSTAIIDQHFIKRKRHNRLISLVLENPDLPGIGIDESTAIHVKPDSTFEVYGRHTVLVYDASAATEISTNERGDLSANGIQMHLLQSGQEFNLKTRTPPK